MTENTISTFTFDFPLTFALASCENYLPHYTLCYTYHLVFCSCFSAKVCFKLQSDSFAFSFALRSVFKQTHRAVMWVNTWFMSWKCSIKSFWKRASFYVLCLILAMCLMSLMCHSVLCSRAHKKVSTPLLRFFFFFFFSPPNLSLFLFFFFPFLLTRAQVGQSFFVPFFFFFFFFPPSISLFRSFSASLYEWNLIGCSDVSEMFH